MEKANDTPLQYSCLENPMDGGAWWAAVHGVSKSQTQLSNFTFTFHFHALGKELATHSCSCLENPRDGRAWWATIYGAAESDTTEALSSSSDFPGDSVVKKLPAHAGVMSLIPDLGRPHVLWSNQICAPQLFSWFSRAWEPQLLQSLSSRAHALQQEKARQ